MKSFLFLMLFFSIQGCASMPSSDLNSYQSLEVHSFSEPDFNQIITKTDAESDIVLLKYALERGYIASLYRTQYSPDFSGLLSLKSQLPQQITVRELADRIGDLFWKMEDGHLFVRNPKGGMISPLRDREERKANVGINALIDVCHKTNRAYAFREVLKRGHHIPVLSICSLPQPDDPSWTGFDEVLSSVSRHPYLVIDLRGLPGGSDTNGFKLAEKLLGAKIPDARGLKAEVMGRTPENIQLLLNQILGMQDRYTKKGEQVPASWIEMQRKIEVLLKTSLQKGAPPYEIQKSPQFVPPSPENVAFKGKVYVLIDAKCGSSCESTLEALLWNPNVITVGENTRGLIHFTEQGYLTLPKSHIALSIPTKYNEYEEFIEKIGHKPMLEVPSGQDALEWLAVHMQDSDETRDF